VGDIILFKAPHYILKSTGEHLTIVHRIAQINVTSTGQHVIRTKGDHNPASIAKLDYPIYAKDYIGKVIFTIPKVGSPFVPSAQQ
jgi:signal peptidase I